METFQLYFELIGAVAFAISGAALGIRKGMAKATAPINSKYS